MKRWVSLLLLAGLFGCDKKKHIPEQDVCLIDLSGSIERSSEDDAFTAVDTLISHLERGDAISIIPITGDALNETSGQILRFRFPDRRQAYDADLKSFRNMARSKLRKMHEEALLRPGAHTDILGTIRLAREEFEADRANQQTLLILSDFIQDDRTANFKRDPRLRNPIAARNAAMQIGSEYCVTTSGAVLLGFLGSSDLASLSRERREAIREFWTALFTQSGTRVHVATDGPGIVAHLGRR